MGNLSVLKGDKPTAEEVAASDGMPIDQAIMARLRRKVHSLALNFQPSTGTFTGTRGVYTGEEIAGLAWVDKMEWPKASYSAQMGELIRELRLESLRRIKGALLDAKGDRDAGVRELTKLVKLLAHPKTNEETLGYYLVAWRQLIWQVKRKLRGLPTSWEMMLCLYSKQGTGKSQAVAKFGAPLKQLFMGMADFDLFSDKFRLPQLHTHYLVCLDEMGHARRTDINTIKQLITAETVQSRRMYSQSEVALTRNASFIATTNRPLMASLSDSTGMRRFVEMRCRDNEADQAQIKSVNALDFTLMWMSESGERDSVAPTAAHRALFTRHQNAAASKSDFEYWADACLTSTGDDADKVRNSEAYASYTEHCEKQRHKPISIQLFARELRERYGDIPRINNKVYFSGLVLGKGDE